MSIILPLSFFFLLYSSFFLKLHANTMDHTVVVVVGHAVDHAISVGFFQSNRRCARWWCSGRRHACAVVVWVAVLLGFVGFPSVGG